MADLTSEQRRPTGVAPLAFTILFPSAVTWVYFVALASHSSGFQQTAAGLGKLAQFSFPMLYVWWIQKQPIRLSRPNKKGFWPGLVFGIAVFAGMLAVYHGLLKSSPAFDEPARVIRAKAQEIGVATPSKYILLGAFYVVGHSFLEEYYWRWFVFKQLALRISVPSAVLVSSLGFMAHHVIVLGRYFGWDSPLTYVFSISVAMGGAYWAWLLRHYQSLYPSWLSHAIVDLAIFTVGYDVIRGALT